MEEHAEVEVRPVLEEEEKRNHRVTLLEDDHCGVLERGLEVNNRLLEQLTGDARELNSVGAVEKDSREMVEMMPITVSVHRV